MRGAIQRVTRPPAVSSVAAVSAAAAAVTSAESDYGSDLDDDTWDAVFAQIESQPLHDVGLTSLLLETTPPPAANDDDEQQLQHETCALHVARAREHLRAGFTELESLLAHIEAAAGSAATKVNGGGQAPRAVEAVNEEKHGSNAVSESPNVKQEYVNAYAVKTEDVSTQQQQKDSAIAGRPAANTCNGEPFDSQQEVAADSRSPLERFRTRPKKPLSVTDIISPAWCELQYWYSLTKYGRIKKTPAMKKGSKIHKKVEEEVHVSVPVQTATAEDRFGLRLWNIITGLRTLRATGLTRELEVLGLVDGEVIIGVIDEVTSACPDVEFEAALAEKRSGSDGGSSPGRGRVKASKKEAADLAKQPTIAEFYARSNPSSSQNAAQASQGATQNDRRSLYLVDIKTRRSKTLPKGDQVRPTRMQLMLYWRLLTDLAAGKVEGSRIFARYNLDASQCFSDVFLAAIGNVSGGVSDAADDAGATADSMDEIIAHNTIASLWTLMTTEFAQTVGPADLSPLLTVEYRDSSTTGSGEVLGKRSFAFDAAELDPYVESEMHWWRGHRAAQGVEIEEAYKCGFCEFAEACSWRIDKSAEAKDHHRRASANLVPPVPA